ncbi:Dyp-type peroxidase [Leeia oryzae]|uniref:Dyp-type peroxidase n=1 Tax=Leeia oryzae TaxID=356662 RepID=UPI00037FD939|nr:Dyp-type peroxidase [Leeia oryzae]
MLAYASHQGAVLDPVTPVAVHLLFDIADTHLVKGALTRLATIADGQQLCIGIGQPLATLLNVSLPGLSQFQAPDGARVDVPSTPHALWCWVRGSERGDLVHLQRHLMTALGGAFRLAGQVESFCYHQGRDLTGYEDGTENPEGDDAADAALQPSGASCAVLQQWQHLYDKFEAMSPAEQDNAIGRRKSDNEELEDAPASAHVKRTAQESFTPEAFMLRRSMPWAAGDASGLMFLAFGRNFHAFEAQLTRMTGAEDDVVDALFTFSRPLWTAYFWCPPVKQGCADLSALDLA